MPRKSILDARTQRLRFRRNLVSWFRRNGRDLPWRRTRDPWAILVSEVMLQQTQVSRVVEYWPRFLEAFPTARHLAGVSPRTVRDAWDGLGYYRRAANLHRAAGEMVTHWKGRVPRDVNALKSLPGVGAYTAGAVASFAFELAEPAVDTNVGRVLRRVFHPRLPRGAAGERRLDATARALIPRAGGAAWVTNQALMELGALVCTARVMRCNACPVQSVCATGRRRARVQSSA